MIVNPFWCGDPQKDKNGEADQMPNAAPYQGLHCLQIV